MLQTLEEMAAQGIRPDVGVLNIVINLLVSSGMVAAFAKISQVTAAMITGWASCSADVQTLEEMAAQGIRPDVGVLNIVINLLVSSGVVAAFAKAAQLFNGATRQGQLRWGLFAC